MPPQPPPIWTREELRAELEKAIAHFRTQRMEEPLEEYLEAFDKHQGVVEELLESTVDLRQLNEQLVGVLTDPNLLEAFRYLSGPPISADDLKTVAEAVLSPGRLRKDDEMARRVANVVMTGLDRRRFPWVRDNREPTEAERSAAVLASAALLATQKLGTHRRNTEKERQEGKVKEALSNAHFEQLKPREISVLVDAPAPGQFCGESRLGTRKADIVVGLWDRRVMPIECKVSNSALNSVKRLNNDAAVKAQTWRQEFGNQQVVPTAVLSGVYKLHNLEDAQGRGLTLFWAHDLERLTQWIEGTR